MVTAFDFLEHLDPGRCSPCSRQRIGALSKNRIMRAYRTQRGLCTEGSSSGTSRTSQCSPREAFNNNWPKQRGSRVRISEVPPSPRLQSAARRAIWGVCWIDVWQLRSGTLRGHLVTSNIMAYASMPDGDALQTGGWHTALVEGRRARYLTLLAARVLRIHDRVAPFAV